MSAIETKSAAAPAPATDTARKTSPRKGEQTVDFAQFLSARADALANAPPGGVRRATAGLGIEVSRETTRSASLDRVRSSEEERRERREREREFDRDPGGALGGVMSPVPTPSLTTRNEARPVDQNRTVRGARARSAEGASGNTASPDNRPMTAARVSEAGASGESVEAKAIPRPGASMPAVAAPPTDPRGASASGTDATQLAAVTGDPAAATASDAPSAAAERMISTPADLAAKDTTSTHVAMQVIEQIEAAIAPTDDGRPDANAAAGESRIQAIQADGTGDIASNAGPASESQPGAASATLRSVDPDGLAATNVGRAEGLANVEGRAHAGAAENAASTNLATHVIEQIEAAIASPGNGRPDATATTRVSPTAGIRSEGNGKVASKVASASGDKPSAVSALSELQATAPGRAAGEPARNVNPDGLTATIVGRAEGVVNLEGRLRAEPGLAPPQPGAAAAPLAAASTPAPASASATTATYTLPTPLSSPQWAKDFADIISVSIRDRVQEAEVRIEPRELGPITLRLSLDGDVASIAFSATHPETQTRLEGSLDRLRDVLAESGLQLGNATVDGGGAQGDRNPGANPRSPAVTRLVDAPDGGEPRGAPAAPPRGRSLIDTFA